MKIKIEEELFNEMFNYIYLPEILTSMSIHAGEDRTNVAICSNDKRTKLLHKIRDSHKSESNRLIWKCHETKGETQL